ncbi:MAG: hypothetical protein ABSH39_24195 [Candidatus Acidiferrum sp.]|jgi:uncharacterized membrane protein
MSSTAAAPTPSDGKQAQNQRQFPHFDIPELLTQEPTRTESLAVSVQPIDDAARLERLLSQLEARSMALVPYGYGTVREPPAKSSNTALVASILVAIWLTTVVLTVAYIRYSRPAEPIYRASPATPLLIPSEADPQEQKVARSVDHLAKALVSSSQRMDELQRAMDRNNRGLQRITTRAGGRQKAAAATITAEGTETALASAPAEGSVLKNWHKVLEIKPSESAVPHKSDDGTIDYWLVPRGAEQVQTKVLPVGTSPEGVVVHNLEDGKDYTLTPSGEWRTSVIDR